MRPKRIWILGRTASGKTTLANKISEKLKIPLYSTDDIVYKKKWSERNSESIRIKKSEAISKKSSWIIEGAHSKDWINSSIKRADLIIFLDMNRFRLFPRIVRRQKMRKKNSEVDVDFFNLARLFWWTVEHSSGHYKRHKKDNNFVILKNPNQVKRFLEELK